MEVWLPVKGFEAIYEVSDLGRVRSVDRKICYSDGRVRFYRGVLLKPSPTGKGYPAVNLSVNNRKKMHAIHAIVAEAFLGDRPPKKQVAHFDGDLSNPALRNLRYATPKENEADKIMHGTKLVGQMHGNAVLSERDVIAIRERAKGGEPTSTLASEFGVSVGHIRRLKHRLAWKHL